MAIQMNLAMTGGEILRCSRLPPDIAWMACHFSLCHGGLSGLPPVLPPGSVLVLDDQTPMNGHDPERIGAELKQCVQNLGCSALLLDFQRPGFPEAAALAARLQGVLPCPVAVTSLYAPDRGPVFLPPLPCHVPLRDWLAPWQGRELWLELALDREAVTLTEEGADISPGDFDPGRGFADENLHCHYRAAVEETKAVFRLWRTRQDLEGLLKEANDLGVRRAVGLYQELGGWYTNC